MSSQTTQSFIVLLLLLFGFSSCTTRDPDCYEPKNVSSTASFSHRKIDSVSRIISINGEDTVRIMVADTTYPDTVLRSPFFMVLNEDSVFAFLGQTISYGSFYLNPAKDSIQYLFTPDTSVRDANQRQIFDTITVHYTPTLHFISNNCGYNYYFTINNIRVDTPWQFIDSFSILNNSVTNSSSIRNFKLILKK